MNYCPWCTTKFSTKKDNQRFCSEQCRNLFHSACRGYTAALIGGGFLTTTALRCWTAMHGNEEG